MPNSPAALSDDPRAQRSRQRLQGALRRLLGGEELGNIGVAELCREAGVHRTTFYGHYASVGDLAADLFATMIDEASEVAPVQGAPSVVAQAYLDGTVSILRNVADERSAIRALLLSQVSLGFRKRLRTYFLDRASIAIDVIRANGVAVPGDHDIASAYIAGGLVSAIEMWATVDDDDVEGFAREILRNLPAWWPALDN